MHARGGEVVSGVNFICIKTCLSKNFQTHLLVIKYQLLDIFHDNFKKISQLKIFQTFLASSKFSSDIFSLFNLM